MRKAMMAKAEHYGYEGKVFVESKNYVKQFDALLKDLWLDENKVMFMTSEEIYTYCARNMSIDLLSKYLLKLIANQSLVVTPIKPKSDHNRPLIEAIMRGDENTVRLLVAIGVNILKPDLENGSLPLHFAAQHGCHQSVELFLDKGADVNAVSSGGSTALCFALGSGSVKHPETKILETVKLLLVRKANQNLHTQSGLFPIHLAVRSGLDNEDQVDRPLNGDTPLCIAVGCDQYKGQETVVEVMVGLLLEHGANPNTPAANGSPPLHFAAQRGFNQVVTMLLEYGARVNDLGNGGRSAIYFAAKAKKKETVRLLLAYGAAPDGLLDFI
jgi:uncharacterized protein